MGDKFNESLGSHGGERMPVDVHPRTVGFRKVFSASEFFHTPSIPFGGRTGTYRDMPCSIVVDFSGDLSGNRLSVSGYNGFGMQGSLVQIQSSRPVKFTT